MPELLLELFSEEIPARMQMRAAADLEAAIASGLAAAGLEHGRTQAHATPRRLVVAVDELAKTARDVSEDRKGPRTDAPEKAIEGFLKSAGVSLADCEVRDDKKGSFYVAKIDRPGRDTMDVVAELVPDIVRRFPWPRSMRWGSGSLRWVRPLKSILCTFGGDVVPFEIDGIRAGTVTHGHRFMAPDAIIAKGFEDYSAKLRQAFVLVDADERIETIRDQATKLAAAHKLDLIEDEALLREVAGLVEWPVVLIGEFDGAFLDVPPEVVVTSIRSHQKCFALKARSGSLASKYLLVANLIARDGGKQIVTGNNRVIDARLSDAKFFWDQDRKVSLESRLGDLENITFHARLGTQRERVARIEALAGEIAGIIGADEGQARLAARLCKADLVTGMVGEFPELQGLMGGYYARAEGLAAPVADAIRDHYKPQGPSEPVPHGKVAQAVALADKLDTLVGFWAIDEKPTGSKDPYALRRAALGAIRIVLEGKLRLDLIELTIPSLASAFVHLEYETIEKHIRSALDLDEAGYTSELADRVIAGSASRKAGKKFARETVDVAYAIATDLLAFFADRLKVYLRDQGARHDLIDAVFSLGQAATVASPQGEGERSAARPQDDLLMVVRRVEALGKFLDTDDGRNLLAGVKRATNILRIEEKKDGHAYDGRPFPNLLVQGEEKALHRAIQAAQANARKAVTEEDFEAAMRAIAKLRAPVDRFFDKVTVNADDPTFRENRLKLLNMIREATLTVADFTRIEG